MYAMNLTPTAAPDPRSSDAEPDLGQLFTYLTTADWNPRALSPRLPDIAALAHQLPPHERTAWLDGLHGAWHRHGWALSARDRLALLRLAALWRDWPMVVGVGERLLADGQLPDQQRLTLAYAWRCLGDGESALEHARHYLLAHPRCVQGEEEYAAVVRWRAFRAHYGLDGAPIGDGDGLMLEPLAHHHLGDFARQFSDPAIAELCCMPHFASDEHWHRWLDETYGYGDQLPFAVIHAEWGFIGEVSLVLQGEVGFFHYWIGPNFQGNGFGPRAVTLLLDQAAARWGLTTCYAKVFDYNTPSRRALAKMGFEALDIRAAALDEEELFYRLGPAVERAAMVAELHTLLARMGSSTLAAAPLGG